MIKYLLALFLIAVSAPAWAQCTTLPFTLQNGPVADGGQVMANFNALNANCGPGAGATNRFVMTPSTSWTSSPTSTTAWAVVPPPGVSFTCGGTNSQCLQEVFSAAFTAGASVDLYCPGENQANTTYPFLSSAVTLSPSVLAQRYVHLHGCNVTFSSAVTGDGFLIDSTLDGGYFWIDGQVQLLNNAPTSSAGVPVSCGVRFKPTTNAPAEGAAGKVIASARIGIGAIAYGSVAAATPAGANLCLDATASTMSADIWVGEINCNGPSTGAVTKDGVNAFNASSTTGIFRDRITIGSIHNCRNGYVNGSNGTLANYKQNEITIQNCSLVNPDNTTGVCYDESGSANIVKIYSANNEAGAFKNAVALESGASNDIVTIGNFQGTGAALLNSSGNATNTVISGGAYLAPAAVSCSGITAGTVTSTNGILTHC